MDDKKNYEIFPGKTLSQLFNDIYENSKNTESQSSHLINQLKPFIKNLNDAIVVVPLIREYLDIKVKSDEQLVKLSDTVQRLLRSDSSTGESGSILTDEEKAQLLDEVLDYDALREKNSKKLETLDEQTEKIKENFSDNQKMIEEPDDNFIKVDSSSNKNEKEK